MFNKVEEAVINTMVQNLNDHGFNVSPDSLKEAIDKEAIGKEVIDTSPQIIQKIESILLSDSPDKLAKITALISEIKGQIN